jgi:integrase
MKLTPKTIEHLKPRDRRVEIPDTGCAGLYLVLQPSGARSWATRFRFGGRPTKLTIGAWPKVSLHDARVAATEALKQVKQGNDPAKARQDARIEAMETASNTVASVCAAYMRREAGKLRTSAPRESTLRRLIYPHIGERPIGEIKRSEIVRLLDKIEDNSGPRAADTALGLVRRIFHWHELRDDEFRSPIIRGMARQNAKDHRRTRILDDDELRKLWAATADGSTFSALVRFLLLTGARRNEAAAMRRDEVDADGIWALPPGRSKTKTEVVRPLSKAALAVLDGLPRIDGCDFAFASATGRSPISQFSSPKERLDAASGVTGYTIHDLRRTARSLMSRAGVDVDVAERLLGHSRGDLRERYDRHTFLPEMTRAVEMLSALIARIINPPEGAVIPMRRR